MREKRPPWSGFGQATYNNVRVLHADVIADSAKQANPIKRLHNALDALNQAIEKEATAAGSPLCVEFSTDGTGQAIPLWEGQSRPACKLAGGGVDHHPCQAASVGEI